MPAASRTFETTIIERLIRMTWKEFAILQNMFYCVEGMKIFFVPPYSCILETAFLSRMEEEEESFGKSEAFVVEQKQLFYSCEHSN